MPHGTETPFVTIVTPARNAAEDLPGALESVRSQGIDAFQHIVVNDGSTDGTDEVLTDASRNDCRIMQLRSEGIGPAAARNLAIKHAKAPLIAFLDADDRWRPGKLARQLAFHTAHSDVLLSFTDYEHFTPAGQSLGLAFPFWPVYKALAQTGTEFGRIENSAPLIFAENAVGTSTVVIRKDAFDASGGFDPELRSASDWELWLRLALRGPAAYSTEPAMDYLVMPGSVTSNRALRISCMNSIIETYEPLIAPMDRRAVRAAKARIDIARAEMARETGDHSQALHFHLRALRANPTRRTARSAIADMRNLLVA